MIVTFQDGGLAGYDLAIVEDSWDNDLKQFKLKQNDQENALKVPGDINFSVGDKFILTGLKMPQSYRDNASLQLQEEAQAWLDGKCEKRIQLRGKCDEIVFRLQNIFIACGQMVGVYSEQLDIDREIRVTKIKRYIEKDGTPSYRYELTLSDFLESNGFKDLVDDVNKVPEEIEDAVKPVREHTKRSWRDVMETLGMMFDPEGDYFTELIKPLAVHTAQLIVGTNSQQMELIGMKFIPNADNDANYFKNTTGKLVHFTVSEEIREWAIPAASFRLNNSLAYYVYAKCPKEGTNGSIYVSERQIKLEDETGFYHFWVGVLNTPEDGVRSWLPNYGYTEIAGQTITTGLIKDRLARLVIDLVNARITAINGATIEGKVTFTSGTSGYNNITDKPDLSVYGTKDLLNSIKDNLQNQLDGKIDTYYQSSNPWNSWPSGTEPGHVGDMWYNTSTGVLQTYIGPSSNIWREIVDPAAVEAARAAATAADVKADSKRRVFTSTPRPPYDVGDQWITYGTTGGSMFICKTSRSAGSSYNPSDWQKADIDGNTQVTIDRGIVTAYGFLTFGSTAGMRADGPIRLWCGGTKDNPTFQVSNAGEVMAKTAIRLQNNMAGLTGVGTAATSVRFWAGSSTPESAPFRVTQNGMAYMSGGKIGYFEIMNNRLVWEGRDYFGDTSRTIKLGYGSNNDGLVDVAFGASTQGRFGVKAVGRAPGSAAIYGSSKSTQSYPTDSSVWAAWFDGYMFSDGYFTRSPKGNVRGGLKGAYRIDNSDTWFVFDNGIAVACTKPRSVDLNTDNF